MPFIIYKKKRTEDMVRRETVVSSINESKEERKLQVHHIEQNRV